MRNAATDNVSRISMHRSRDAGHPLLATSRDDYTIQTKSSEVIPCRAIKPFQQKVGWSDRS